MQPTITEIFCSLKVEGLHCWSTCNIQEVIYLRDLHRHIFGFKCYLTVNHDNRDVEFIELKHKISKYLTERYFDEKYQCLNFGGKSCEMLGAELGSFFNLNRIEVNEDEECGSIVYFD